MTRDSNGMLSRKGQVWASPYRWGSTLIAYRKSALLRCALPGNLCVLGSFRYIGWYSDCLSLRVSAAGSKTANAYLGLVQKHKHALCH